MHAMPLHAGALVRITEIRCRPDHPECGEEECASGNHVVFLNSGVFVKHVRGRRIVADAGQVLFFGADEGYRVSHPVPGGDDCTSFDFRSDLLHAVLGGFERRAAPPERPFDRTHSLARPAALLAQRALRHRLLRREADALEAEESALDILAEVARGIWPARPPRRGRERAAAARLRREWIEGVKLILAARPASNFGLGEIAAEVGCSPFHLARLFRGAQGMPIHQYQLRLRLVLALERLLDGSDNLLGLALDLGF